MQKSLRLMVGLSTRDPDSQTSLFISLFALPTSMACAYAAPALHLSLSGSHGNLQLFSSSSSSSCSYLACHGPLSSNANPLTLSATSDKLIAKWRTSVSFFPSFIGKRGKSKDALKEELFEAIAPLDRGAEASPEDQEMVDQIARQLEAANSIKEPLKSDLLNGKWELLYTTSRSILQPQRPKFLRPNGKIYQAINADTLRAQNMETWPYFNQVTADLVPINARRVAVRFDTFKIFGLIPIKSPGSGRGELEITYLDEEIRISRGDKGNLFILKMVDRSYRVPV